MGKLRGFLAEGHMATVRKRRNGAREARGSRSQPLGRWEGSEGVPWIIWVGEELGKKSSRFAYVFQSLISAPGSPRTISIAESSLAPNTVSG